MLLAPTVKLSTGCSTLSETNRRMSHKRKHPNLFPSAPIPIAPAYWQVIVTCLLDTSLLNRRGQVSEACTEGWLNNPQLGLFTCGLITPSCPPVPTWMWLHAFGAQQATRYLLWVAWKM